MSSSAYIVYGVYLGYCEDVQSVIDQYSEEFPDDPLEKDDDWEHVFIKRLRRVGLTKLQESDSDEYYKETRELIKKYGCTLLQYGYFDTYDLYCVADGAPYLWAEVGSYKTITPDQLEVKPEWGSQLQRFMEIMKLPYVEPQWFLVADYD